MSSTPPSDAAPPRPPAGQDQTQYLLGQIHAMVNQLREGQQLADAKLDKLEERMDKSDEKLGARIDKIDDRLRAVETRSAVFGAVSGGAMGVGIALLTEGLKQWLKRGGGTP